MSKFEVKNRSYNESWTVLCKPIYIESSYRI